MCVYSGAVTTTARSEAGRRGLAAPGRVPNWPVDDPAAGLGAGPAQFPAVVDFGAQLILRAAPRHLQRGERHVALGGGAPGGGGGVADRLAALVEDEGIRRRLVAFHVQAHEAEARALRPLPQQGAAPGEVALVEIHQPAQAQLEGRARTC